MSTNERDDERLQPILDTIKAVGEPYGEGPGTPYWVHFRLRVMDDVELREHRRGNILRRLFGWIASQPLRSGMIGFSLTAVVILLLVASPFAPPQPFVEQSQQPNAPQLAQSPKSDFDVNSGQMPLHSKVPDSISKHQVAASVISTPKAIRSSQNVRTSEVSTEEELATLEPGVPETDNALQGMSVSESELPVSLGDLSESELESVVQDLEKTAN